MKKLFGLIVCLALVIVTVVGFSSSNSPPTTGVYTKQIDYYEDFSTKNNEWAESGNPNLSSIYCRFIDGKYQIVNNKWSSSIGATSRCNHRVKDYSVEVDATLEQRIFTGMI